MLTGDIPFNSENYDEIVLKNLNGKINFSVFNSINVESWVVKLLQKMLEKNPE